jgi:hypothetical protein
VATAAAEVRALVFQVLLVLRHLNLAGRPVASCNASTAAPTQSLTTNLCPHCLPQPCCIGTSWHRSSCALQGAPQPSNQGLAQQQQLPLGVLARVHWKGCWCPCCRRCSWWMRQPRSRTQPLCCSSWQVSKGHGVCMPTLMAIITMCLWTVHQGMGGLWLPPLCCLGGMHVCFMAIHPTLHTRTHTQHSTLCATDGMSCPRASCCPLPDLPGSMASAQQLAGQVQELRGLVQQAGDLVESCNASASSAAAAVRAHAATSHAARFHCAQCWLPPGVAHLSGTVSG